MPKQMEKTMKKTYMLLAALAAALLADAAAPTFEKVPDAARSALKGARGRPVRKGLVFVNGHYLPPPYTVARYGTAIFINNIQVTGQIVPWKSFLPPPPGGVSAATPAPAAPPKKASAIDDLFDDGGAPAQQAPAASPADAGDAGGTFVANARTDQLLKRINDYRTDINKRLRNGDACFFGRYGFVAVQQRLSRGLLNVLPEAIRDSENGADLFNCMKAKGFAYLNANICADLIENRADYAALVERRRKMQEDEEVQKMLSNGGQGITP